MKKVIAFMLVLAICFPIGFREQQSAYAAEDTAGIVPSFVGVASLNPVLEMKQYNIARCVVQGKLKTGYAATITYSLQRKSGTSWKPVRTWTDTVGTTISLERVADVVSGSVYRLTAVATVTKSGTFVETVTKYSVEVTA